MNAYINLVKVYQMVHKILSGNEILGVNQGYSGKNVRKMTCNNPKLDLVNKIPYIKFGEYMSICSTDIVRKRNFVVNKKP